jgi:hypothetical protein
LGSFLHPALDGVALFKLKAVNILGRIFDRCMRIKKVLLGSQIDFRICRLAIHGPKAWNPSLSSWSIIIYMVRAQMITGP